MEPTWGGIVFLTIISIPAIVVVFALLVKGVIEAFKFVFFDNGPDYSGISSGSYITHQYKQASRQVKPWRNKKLRSKKND